MEGVGGRRVSEMECVGGGCRGRRVWREESELDGRVVVVTNINLGKKFVMLRTTKLQIFITQSKNFLYILGRI